MTQDAAKKARADAIAAAVAQVKTPTKEQRLAALAKRIEILDGQIARLQERRSALEDELIATNDA